jgi:TRAP-type uncharacterized transport system substrate-binding protein
MTSPNKKSIRFGSSWSTQFRLTQALGRGLAALMPIDATVILTGSGPMANLANDEIDVCFLKSVNNEHRYTGKGLFAADKPDTWLRTIAWLPQEDRMLFAMAPWTNITSFEQLVSEKPALHMAGGSAPQVLKEYGFSYDDIKAWGGSVSGMEHTAAEAQARSNAGTLDALFGDGSAYDFSAWVWVAAHGYRFLDISEEVMRSMEAKGLRRNVTPAGFLMGIDHTLTALDDSHIVVTVRDSLDDEVAYNLAKAIDENKQDIELSSIQINYSTDAKLPVTQLSYWTSVTSPIDRQWDETIVGAPLHPGAKRYYQEKGVL